MWSICRSGRYLRKKGIQNETGLLTVYNGKELDEMTGLSFFEKQYYDSRLGMFLGIYPFERKMKKYKYVLYDTCRVPQKYQALYTQ